MEIVGVKSTVGVLDAERGALNVEVGVVVRDGVGTVTDRRDRERLLEAEESTDEVRDAETLYVGLALSVREYVRTKDSEREREGVGGGLLVREPLHEGDRGDTLGVTDGV